MEQALFFDLVRNFVHFDKYCRAVSRGFATPDGCPPYTRIYAGAEFCVHRLPSVGQISAAGAMCAESGLRFTLVLPPMFDTSFEKIDRLLGLMKPGTEVVVNDWGQLDAVVDARLIPIMGRALNRLVRDPRIDGTARDLDAMDFLMTSQAHIPMVREMLTRKGIARIELDNVRQGLNPAPDCDIPFSLYTPWTLVSVSRFCGPNYAATCPGKPCFYAKTFVEDVPIIADGTCTFWFNPVLPAAPGAIGIDRLVHVAGPEGMKWLEHGLENPHTKNQESVDSAWKNNEGGLLEKIVLQALNNEYTSVCHIMCGRGGILEIIDRYDKRLTGLDKDDESLGWAKKRVPDATLINAAGIDSLHAAEPFDLVIALSFGDNDIDTDVRGVLRNTAPGGILMLSIAPDRLTTLKPALQNDFLSVWQHETNNGRQLMVLVEKNAAPGTETRLADLIKAFIDKGFDSHDEDFVDLTRHIGRTPGKGGEPEWIGTAALHVLADIGFKYLWRELEGEGRIMYRLAGDDRKMELEFSPTSQNRAKYRTCPAPHDDWNVAYHEKPDDMGMLDRAIDILAETLTDNQPGWMNPETHTKARGTRIIGQEKT